MMIAMPAMTAKAANRLPLTPKRKPLTPELNNAICPLPRLHYLEVFPRAAVSRYPVNKFGKTEPFFATILALAALDFSVNRKTQANEQSKQKGRRESRPSAILN
ncbi:hypothetical protein [Bradyrhizobium sp. RDI18]|uniref:hypothetical protein n=1 Tax=Bradyrhizobium sp. RDI18 TaxID=3367400 RepID=UPI0037173ACF